MTRKDDLDERAAGKASGKLTVFNDRSWPLSTAVVGYFMRIDKELALKSFDESSECLSGDWKIAPMQQWLGFICVWRIVSMVRWALVIGASGGIGKALSSELRATGYRVAGLSRSESGFEITDEKLVSEHLGRFEIDFDLIIVATGNLASGQGPEKSIKALSAVEMTRLFKVNAIGPAMVLKHSKRLMPKRRRSVFAVLSARVGSIGDNALGGWYSYRTSKAALNQVVRTASIEFNRTHPDLICVALHPGTVATEFTKNYPQHKTVSAQAAARNILRVIDRLTPEDSGGFFDWAGKSVPW